MNLINRKPRQIKPAPSNYAPSPEEKRTWHAIEELRRPLQEFAMEPETEPQHEPARRDRLAELADLLAHLTWGEMDEYCKGSNSKPEDVHKWCKDFPQYGLKRLEEMKRNDE